LLAHMFTINQGSQLESQQTKCQLLSVDMTYTHTYMDENDNARQTQHTHTYTTVRATGAKSVT